MKTIYRCSECGEDYKPGSPTAKNSNIGTVDSLIYHIDPCPNCCNDNAELDKIFELEQENAKLKRQIKLDYGILKTYEVRAVKAESKIHNIEEGAIRLGEFIATENRTPELQNYLAFDFDREIYTLVRWDGAEIYAAPTVPDLIDEILTGGNNANPTR